MHFSITIFLFFLLLPASLIVHGFPADVIGHKQYGAIHRGEIGEKMREQERENDRELLGENFDRANNPRRIDFAGGDERLDGREGLPLRPHHRRIERSDSFLGLGQKYKDGDKIAEHAGEQLRGGNEGAIQMDKASQIERVC